MEHLTGFDRTQAVLFPTAIDEMIAGDNLVRVIDGFADSLDFEKLGFKNTRLNKEGRPPYHPSDLLKLYLYGYLNRYRSSRMLENECKRNLELMWLLRGLQPDHNTIANFRKDNPKAIKKVFRQTVIIAKNMNLIGGALIAGDSTKLRAQNSKKNNYNEKKIKRHLEYIEQKLKEHNRALAEADGDTDEDEEKRHHHRQEMDKHQRRRKEYERLSEKLKTSGEKQISTSDPESRHMITRNNMTEVAYNIQTTMDAGYSLLLDYKVTNENDGRALGPMVARAKSILRKNDFTVLFDKGYHTAMQLGHCHRMGIDTLVAVPAMPASAQTPFKDYHIDNFIYDPKTDTYTCPQDQVLKTNGSWYQKGRSTRVKQYKTKACLDCEFVYLCTKNPIGRMIERNEFADSVKRNRKAVEADPELYKKRQQIVEHPYGTLKRQWGFDHIMTKKTMKRASSDVGLMMIAYNFRRLLSILGSKDLKEALKALVFVFLLKTTFKKLFWSFWAPLDFTSGIFTGQFKSLVKRLIFGRNWQFGGS